MRTSLLVLFNLSKSHFATLFSLYSAIWFISSVFLMMRSWKRDCHAKGMLFWRKWQVIARLNPPITTDNAPRLCDISRILLSTVSVFQRACCDGRGCRDDVHIVSTLAALEILGTMEELHLSALIITTAWIWLGMTTNSGISACG